MLGYVVGKSQFWIHDGSVYLTLTFVFIITHNDLPQRTLPLYLKRFSHTHTHTHTWLAIPGDMCKIIVFTSSTPFPLCPIKEPGTQTLTRWLFWDISLPSSSSAGFLNKVVFLASTSLSDSLACRVASRMSLDSVTVILFMISIWKITNLNQFSSCKEKFPFKLNMTYSNLVNYTFVSRSETFIFSLYLLSPETGDSSVPSSFIR